MGNSAKSDVAASEEAYGDSENTAYALGAVSRLDRPARNVAPIIKGPDPIRPSASSAVEEGGGYRTGHTDNHNHPDATPLLPSAGEVDVDPEEAWRRLMKVVLKRGFKQLGVGFVLVIVEGVVLALLGLAINPLSDVQTIPESVPIAVLLTLIAVFAEIMLVCLVIPILMCCFPRAILPYTIGALALVAAGFSIYLLSIVGFHDSHGTCDADKNSVACSRALSRAIAAGCIRLLLSVPLYIGIAVAYYMASRGGPRRTGLWMRFVYGVGDLFKVAS
ncbi:uncharacterized protein DNG_06348 [Cephalotrichum gorgonifer]|uniref:Uncharacterized protein n=1 Tax=Cephalotrichum gorgonifer TaxID=2041049 RepID=A0AAE8MZQ9_9PEZI|nr:uncharacterized protein DNG_06348 [Cephalotrichum gorgonifer]